MPQVPSQGVNAIDDVHGDIRCKEDSGISQKYFNTAVEYYCFSPFMNRNLLCQNYCAGNYTYDP